MLVASMEARPSPEAEPRFKRGTRLVMFALILVVGGCVIGPSQSINVSIIEGRWSIDPEVVEDTARLEFGFTNRGTEAHLPIVLSTDESAESLAEALAERGTADLVLEVVTPDTPSAFHLLGFDGGGTEEGHFHPGSDEPDLPPDALTYSAEGETIGYLFTQAVGPGNEQQRRATAGQLGDSFATVGLGTTFVVLCMDLEHDGRGEYAIFEIAR